MLAFRKVSRKPLLDSLSLLSKTRLASALYSGYLLVFANMTIQFALTPFYLTHLGEEKFGALMIMMNLINFSALGITWMSGGLVRVSGEFWAAGDLQGFRNVFLVAKIVFFSYAISSSVLGLIGWSYYSNSVNSSDTLSMAVVLLALYFVFSYEALPERQIFVGTNRQDTGNYFELIKVILTGCAIYFLLPKYPSIEAVLVGFIGGVATQRVLTSLYWRGRVAGLRWHRPSKNLLPLFGRLIGKQGMGYTGYGVLLLMLQGDTMLIGLLGGANAAAQFVLLWKIPEAISLLLGKIPSTVEPKVIELDALKRTKDVESLFLTGRRIYLSVVFLASIGYAFLGPWLAQLWVGEFAPREHWMYLVAAVALFLNSIARWPISFAYALIRLGPLWRVAAVELTLKLSFTLLLFPVCGVIAPIMASIGAHALFAGPAYQRLIKRNALV